MDQSKETFWARARKAFLACLHISVADGDARLLRYVKRLNPEILTQEEAEARAKYLTDGWIMKLDEESFLAELEAMEVDVVRVQFVALMKDGTERVFASHIRF
jgi:hypothetical protein